MKVNTELKNLKEKESLIHIVHYSCQNLSDSNDGLSPRITSIAVLHFSSKMMHSFSLHLVAEKKGISREEIPDNFDKLESEMLGEFYEFVSSHSDAVWVHWNMSNINYGFEVLEHRYEVLTKKQATKIADVRRKNLSSIITSKYGRKCVDHPRMENLMKVNGGVPRDFLSGEDEVQAFDAKEFLRLHKSTMTKAYWFSDMLHKVFTNKLRTQHSNWIEKTNRVLESAPAKVVGFLASIFTIGHLISLLF
jgi:hypothetical protein